jgi:hypothetical protein
MEFPDNSLRFEGICRFWAEFENFHREFFKSMFYSLLRSAGSSCGSAIGCPAIGFPLNAPCLLAAWERFLPDAAELFTRGFGDFHKIGIESAKARKSMKYKGLQRAQHGAASVSR